jgi:hypothetical protein
VLTEGLSEREMSYDEEVDVSLGSDSGQEKKEPTAAELLEQA